MSRPLSLALLVTLAWCAPAHAEEDARAHNERATAAFALGNYSGAASEWEKAYSLKPQPALLYNAAQAHRLGNNKPRALLLYQNYLRLYRARVQNAVEVERHTVALQRAIETDARVTGAPPQHPAPSGGGDVTRSRSTAGAVGREPVPSTMAPSAAVALQPVAVPAPRASRSRWVAPVVIVVVLAAAGVAVGVGVGVGTASPATDPTPTLGALHFRGM